MFWVILHIHTYATEIIVISEELLHGLSCSSPLRVLTASLYSNSNSQTVCDNVYHNQEGIFPRNCPQTVFGKLLLGTRANI